MNSTEGMPSTFCMNVPLFRFWPNFPLQTDAEYARLSVALFGSQNLNEHNCYPS